MVDSNCWWKCLQRTERSAVPAVLTKMRRAVRAREVAAWLESALAVDHWPTEDSRLDGSTTKEDCPHERAALAGVGGKERDFYETKSTTSVIIIDCY